MRPPPGIKVQIGNDYPRCIVAGSTGDIATWVRAGSTHIEPFYGSPILATLRKGAFVEDLTLA